MHGHVVWLVSLRPTPYGMDIAEAATPKRTSRDRERRARLGTMWSGWWCKPWRRSPAGATHWSTRSMAKACGLSAATISRIWRAFGLKPHRCEHRQAVARFRWGSDNPVRYQVLGLYRASVRALARWILSGSREVRPDTIVAERQTSGAADAPPDSGDRRTQGLPTVRIRPSLFAARWMSVRRRGGRPMLPAPPGGGVSCRFHRRPTPMS